MAKSKVPLGKAKRYTDKELAELAKIKADDIAKSKKYWRKHAPAKYKYLLDAEEDKS